MTAISVKFERLLDVSHLRIAAGKVCGAGLALLVSLIALQISGRSAVAIVTDSLEASLGSFNDVQDMLTLATPILLAGIAVAIPLRAKVWNIGVDGQLLMGGWAASAVGLHVDGPTIVVLPLMIIAGAAGGAVFALIPAILRADFGVNEVITTLLLNFVAIQWVNWFATDVWRDTGAGVLNSTARIEHDMPSFLGASRLHLGFLAPLILVALLVWAFRVGRWGFEVDMVGGNPRAAEYAGIGVRRHIIGVMVCSGAIAGLAGVIQLTASVHRLNSSLSNGYGISGFIIAALAAGAFILVLAIGIIIAMMFRAGIILSTTGLSTFLVNAVFGLVLVFAGVGEMLARYRVSRPTEEQDSAASSEPDGGDGP